MGHQVLASLLYCNTIMYRNSRKRDNANPRVVMNKGFTLIIVTRLYVNMEQVYQERL